MRDQINRILKFIRIFYCLERSRLTTFRVTNECRKTLISIGKKSIEVYRQKTRKKTYFMDLPINKRSRTKCKRNVKVIVTLTNSTSNKDIFYYLCDFNYRTISMANSKISVG